MRPLQCATKNLLVAGRAIESVKNGLLRLAADPLVGSAAAADQLRFPFGNKDSAYATAKVANCPDALQKERHKVDEPDLP